MNAPIRVAWWPATASFFGMTLLLFEVRAWFAHSRVTASLTVRIIPNAQLTLFLSLHYALDDRREAETDDIIESEIAYFDDSTSRLTFNFGLITNFCNCHFCNFAFSQRVIVINILITSHHRITISYNILAFREETS